MKCIQCQIELTTFNNSSKPGSKCLDCEEITVSTEDMMRKMQEMSDEIDSLNRQNDKLHAILNIQAEELESLELKLLKMEA